MPEVLLLCEYAALNGAERSMLATLGGLQAAGFRLAALAPPEGPLAAALRDQGVAVEPFSSDTAAGVRLSQAQLREQLAERLGQHRPDLVHANSLAMGRLSGPVTRALGIPSLAHLRDIVGLSRQAIADLNCHHRLLAVSAAVRTFHVAAGLDPDKTQVLHNGVDLAQFCPRPATGYLHHELGLPRHVQLAATIGQLGLRKGQDVLLEAAALLADRWPDLHYLLIGQRHSEKEEARQFETALHRAAERLSGRVHFLGRRDDVEQLLPELTLLVHPARQEPLGRVLLEAAASGVAVVATAVGGTEEIFPPASGTACLVPPNDAAALAAAIEAMLHDDAARCRMARAARQRAETAFEVTGAVARLAAYYREVLGSRQTT